MIEFGALEETFNRQIVLTDELINGRKHSIDVFFLTALGISVFRNLTCFGIPKGKTLTRARMSKRVWLKERFTSHKVQTKTFNNGKAKF